MNPSPAISYFSPAVRAELLMQRAEGQHNSISSASTLLNPLLSGCHLLSPAPFLSPLFPVLLNTVVNFHSFSYSASHPWNHWFLHPSWNTLFTGFPEYPILVFLLLPLAVSPPSPSSAQFPFPAAKCWHGHLRVPNPQTSSFLYLPGWFHKSCGLKCHF